MSDDHSTGIRVYDYRLPDGTQLLVVGVVFDGEELTRLPGPWVSRLRALLQKVEAEYPGRTGTDEGIDAVQKTQIASGRVSPGKESLN
ncbi:MAG TPA: hypothetical protein VN903_11160 [Polyangia bacterium]|nr:hypothetical protein [Polyangia bacterium]